MSLAIIGFNSDIGVIRNNGRQGAALGPDAIREVLAKLNIELADYGNVDVPGDDLEAAQAELGQKIASLREQKITPLVLGGGHETAYGHYLGLHPEFGDKKLLIINFDAHFDLRPILADNKGSSGTPFTQIANLRQADFNYFVLGIQPSANSRQLFDKAHELKTEFIYASEFIENLAAIKTKLEAKIAKFDYIYLSFCLDVFNQAFAPGVSAPQALGLSTYQVMPLLDIIFESEKLVAMDIVELNPTYDLDNQTARLAAQLAWSYYAKRFTSSN